MSRKSNSVEIILNSYFVSISHWMTSIFYAVEYHNSIQYNWKLISDQSSLLMSLIHSFAYAHLIWWQRPHKHETFFQSRSLAKRHNKPLDLYNNGIWTAMLVSHNHAVSRACTHRAGGQTETRFRMAHASTVKMMKWKLKMCVQSTHLGLDLSPAMFHLSSRWNIRGYLKCWNVEMFVSGYEYHDARNWIESNAGTKVRFISDLCAGKEVRAITGWRGSDTMGIIWYLLQSSPDGWMNSAEFSQKVIRGERRIVSRYECIENNTRIIDFKFLIMQSN